MKKQGKLTISKEQEQLYCSFLLNEVKEKVSKLKSYGIDYAEIIAAINGKGILPQLVVTKDYKLMLPDKADTEIKMEPLTKAVYLLFLKHPEGITFKHLANYREELTRIYAQLRPNGLTDKAMQSIEDVTNPLQNSINEKCARIKAAFFGEFDDYMAKYYYIDGKRGEAKGIALPRDLVVWE